MSGKISPYLTDASQIARILGYGMGGAGLLRSSMNRAADVKAEAAREAERSSRTGFRP